MSDQEHISFGLAQIKQEGLRVYWDHAYAMTTPKALHELEVECALEAAWEAGYAAGRHDEARAEKLKAVDTAEARNPVAELRVRQHIKIEMAKAVAQALGALSSIIDETGGVR